MNAQDKPVSSIRGGKKKPESMAWGQHIRERLVARIQELPVGTRLPTEIELAREFGVSRLTAYKVMAELQHDGLVRRQKGKGTFVSRREVEIVSGRAVARREQIIFAYPQWFSYDIWKKVDCASQLALHRKLNLVDFKITPETDFSALARLVKDKDEVKGIILIPPGGQVGSKEMAVFGQFGIPVVILVFSEYASLRPNVYCVAKDHFKAGYMMAQELAEKGHRNLGYIANEPPQGDRDRMLAGLKQGLYDHSLRLKNLRRIGSDIRTGESSMAAGYRFTRGLLDEGGPLPTALIYESMAGALAGLRALYEKGLSVPRDMSVIVNDDNDGEVEEFLFPPLTTVAIDRMEMVRRAMDILATPTPPRDKVMTIDVRLSGRASVAAPRG